ncbi:hypothetical protein VIGAN_03088600 [Vigna angularis var. angularis]|uniref:Uncharacterized protein n=1 Tax=Vigna angularis var. angularis TaxID=157739 RepID=A0A0S3RKS7_PHAAN|nr:hypothetical protein VIGAN_03088600 [Vigna angularis var. angularis]
MSKQMNLSLKMDNSFSNSLPTNIKLSSNVTGLSLHYCDCLLIIQTANNVSKLLFSHSWSLCFQVIVCGSNHGPLSFKTLVNYVWK